MTTIKELRLENGLTIVFDDESNRYFGDYHRICVRVSIVFPLHELPAADAGEASFRKLAIETLGDELKVVKRLERMGVPTADVEGTRAAMIKTFLEHSVPYLSRPGYPFSLVRAELNKPRKHNYYG